MSYSISDTTITLTRGDTFKCYVEIMDPSGEPYIPEEGDVIRFAMKSTYRDDEPLLVKDIPINSMMLVIEADETKEFAFGSYVYDIELTTASGEVCTFITTATIKLTEEVY